MYHMVDTNRLQVIRDHGIADAAVVMQHVDRAPSQGRGRRANGTTHRDGTATGRQT